MRGHLKCQKYWPNVWKQNVHNCPEPWKGVSPRNPQGSWVPLVRCSSSSSAFWARLRLLSSSLLVLIGKWLETQKRCFSDWFLPAVGYFMRIPYQVPHVWNPLPSSLRLSRQPQWTWSERGVQSRVNSRPHWTSSCLDSVLGCYGLCLDVPSELHADMGLDF